MSSDSKSSIKLKSGQILTKAYELLGGHKRVERYYGFKVKQCIIFMSFSKDSKRIATIVANDYSIRVWDLEQRSCQCTIFHSAQPTCTTFSYCNKYLLCGFIDHVILICDSYSGKCLYTIEGEPNRINQLEFSPNGQNFASFTISQKIFKIWEFPPKENSSRLFNHDSIVATIAFSPDSKQIMSGGVDKAVKIWDINTKQVVKELKEFKNRITNVAYSPDGKYIAIGEEDSKVTIWQLQNYQHLFSFKGHQNSLMKVEFSIDSKKVITTSCIDKIVKIWKLKTQSCIDQFKSSKYGYCGISQDLKTLIKVGDDQNFLIKNLNSNYKFKMVQLQICSLQIKSVSISESNNLFATVCDDETIKIWKISNGQLVNKIRTSHQQIEFLKNGIHLLSKSHDAIKLWNVLTGECVQNLYFPSFNISSYNLSPTNDQIFLGNSKKEIGMWNLENKQQTKKRQFLNKAKRVLNINSQRPIWIQNCHQGEIIKLKCIENSKYLISCDKNSLQVRDMNLGSLIKKISNPKSDDEQADYYFSPLNSGKKVIIIRNFTELQILDLRTLKVIVTREINYCGMVRQLNDSNLIFCINEETCKNKILRIQSPNFKFYEKEDEEFLYLHEFCQNKEYVICVHQNYIKVFKKSYV